MRRSAALLVIAVVALGSLMPASADPVSCTDETSDVHEISANEAGITGRYALPSEDPSSLVVFMHGYSHKSDSWVTHMQRVADAGAAVVTPDYRGTYVEGGNVRGWFVKEGAQDAIDLATGMLAACPSIETVVLYGISMGGNSSGLAAAAQAIRGDGSPLFDHWFAIEPAANVIETYAGASLLEGVNAFAARAKADIEDEFGGPLAEQPEAYVDGAVVSHLDEIAASGLQGVTVVHGFDDGLVPYNQGRELALGLRAVGMPTDFYSVARRGPNEDKGENTGLTEYVLGPTGQYDEPLAGHGSERSDTHIVTQTGLELLLAMLGGDLGLAASNAEFLVDAEAGIVPIP